MEVFEKTFSVTGDDVDGNGRLRCDAILRFAQEAAEGHCMQLSLDWDTLAKRGLFWAVLRYRVQVTRLPRVGETIRVQTWPLPTTRSAFPRATAAYDRAGGELFRVMGLWALMDRQTRAMVLPGKSDVALEGIIRGDELPAPTSLPPVTAETRCLRTVTEADTDRNGHVNNTRYVAWAADLLPPQFRQSHTLAQCQLCYLSEATLGQEIAIEYRLGEDLELVAEGHRTDTNERPEKTRVFGVRMVFAPGVL